MENYSIKTHEQIADLTMSGAFREDIQKKGKLVVLKDLDGVNFTTLSTNLLYPEISSLFTYLYDCIKMNGKSVREIYKAKNDQIEEEQKYLETEKDVRYKERRMKALKSKKDELREEISATVSKLRNSKKSNIKINEPARLLRKKSDMQSYEFILSIIILRQRFKRLYYDSMKQDKEYNELVKKIDEIYFNMRSCVAEETFFELMYFLIKEQEELCSGVKSLYRIEKFSDEDILNILKEDIGQEDFKNHFNLFLVALKKRSNIIKKLEDQGFITRQEIKENTFDDMFYELYKEKRQSYVLKYCRPEDLFRLYNERDEKGKRYINSDTLMANTTLYDILTTYALPKEELFNFLTAKKRPNKDPITGLILGQYMAGFWTLEELKTLISFDYLSYAGILELYDYIENSQILEEFIKENGGQKTRIDGEAMVEIFSPEVVFKECSKNNMTAGENFFYQISLKRIYMEQGKDLEKDLVNYVEEQNKEDKHTRDISLIDLYCKKMLNQEDIQLADISEEMFIEYYKSHESDIRMLIMFYNQGFISNFAVIEELNEDIASIIKLGRLGLNLSVLQGFFTTTEIRNLFIKEKINLEDIYKLKNDIGSEEIRIFTTTEIIDLIRKQKINLEDLHNFKNDIDLEEIRALYLDSKLTYAELYILADNGAISKEDADKIDADFDLKESLDRLRQRGIKGKHIIVPGSSFMGRLSNPNSKKNKSVVKPGGLSPILKGELFDALGGSRDVIEFAENHPFSGCVLIPIFDKKVGIIEGDGRTCVVPLKIAIEYIENPGSADDIFGNATRRDDVYINKKYVSSLYHTKNWGRNLVKAVVERSSELTPADTKKVMQDVNQVNVNGKTLLLALQDSYVDRKKDANRH